MAVELSNIELSSQSHLFKKHVAGMCHHPVKVRYFDCATETYKERYVPCGTCLHCVSRKQQDWVTRMSLQSMESKNTYFVTLTFDRNYLDKDKDMFNQLHCIKYNGSTLPLLLAKKPLQDFFKRLRFNTNIKIQYYACGEYGDTYGRPHYHVILWTDDLLSYDDIDRAWSKSGESIGRIQFDNLRTNGTLDDLFRDSDLESPKDNISSKNCFKYCAKYCTKYYRNVLNIPTIKLIKDYYESNIKGKIYEKRFNICNCPIANYQYKDYREFVEEYKPFVVCSTKSAISSSYFSRCLESWNHEVPNKIESFGHEFITPSYARKLWRDTLYPYRVSTVKNANKISIANPMAQLRQIVYLSNIYIDRCNTGVIKDSETPSFLDMSFYNKITKEHIFINSITGMCDTYEFIRGFGYVGTGSFPITTFCQTYSNKVVNYISLLRQNESKNREYNQKYIKDLNIFLDRNCLSWESFCKLHDDVISSLRDEFLSRQDKYLAKKRFKNQYNKLLS